MTREYRNNGWMHLYLCLITLLLVFDRLFAFSAVVVSSSGGSTSSSPSQHSSKNQQASFFRTITTWLDQEEIPWRQLSNEDKVFPRDIEINNPILEVISYHTSTLYYLHIIKSPRSRNDCLSPICTRDMTNYVQYLNKQSQLEQQQLSTGAVEEVGARQTALKGSNTSANKISIIHLHEDVWYFKTDIVQCRLRTRLIGNTNNSNRSSDDSNKSSISIPSRIYARKTKAKRIDAGTAIPFLEEHHLWSATRARYYYGLFLPNTSKGGSQTKDEDEDVLVAVATFSTKRKIQRGQQVTRSHELIRFCSRADSTVIGGITKLLRTFITEQSRVDDIITVVDRDWGPGDGWRSIGFETLHVSAPLLMVVNKKDGVRRHLVGAGIQSKNKSNSNKRSNNDTSDAQRKSDVSSGGRPGVEDHVIDELARLHTYEDSLHCLEKYDYYPVYDAGVERLLMVVPGAGSKAAQSSVADDESIQEVEYVPSTYAATYRTSNCGIAALLGHVMSQTASSLYGRYLSEILTEKANVNDSLAAQSDADAWKATGGVGKSESLICSVPSTLDPLASVEVRERTGGWCTLGFVGGIQKSSIRHGNFKMKEDGAGHRYVDSSVMVFEYLRSMAAMALVGLEYSRLHPDTSDDNETEANLSCLYLGYGAGSLPRFMASLLPESNHLSIELDEGVVSAANQCGLLNHSLSSDSTSIELQVGDALNYKRTANRDSFDVVFIDIFDDDNMLPPEFYSTEFLQNVVLHNHLGGHSSGIVIHNFHTGGKALRSQLADAIKNYRDVFSTTLTVESIDSRHTGGNTILLATNKRRLDASSETLSWQLAGKMAQQHSGINFDVIARTTHKLWLS
jgi:predicted O-methyltransferase YrrM